MIRTKQLANFDKLVYASGILLPIMTIPQAYEVWVNKQTAGVSLLTWSMYAIIAFFFAAYGILHREKLLIITNVPLLIVDLAVVIGLLAY